MLLRTPLAMFLVACAGSSAPPETPKPATETPPPTETSAGPSEANGALKLGGISVAAPAAWQRGEPSSKMRLAEFAVGEAPDAASMVVYYFEGGAGTVEQNLARWYSQFEQPDGSDTAASAVIAKTVIDGFSVTKADVSGRYVAAVRPGADEKNDKPGYRMLAAIIETDTGHYYFKLIGPASVVAGAQADFDQFVASIKKAGHGAANPHGGSPHGGGW